MSLSVLEAMATGVPAIGSRVLEDIVQPGVHGFIVPEGDEDEMVEAYRRLLRETPIERWREMGAAARRHVETAFSWDAVADRTCAVYRAVADSYGTKR